MGGCKEAKDDVIWRKQLGGGGLHSRLKMMDTDYGNLVDKLSGISIGGGLNNKTDGLLQVREAVEAAEATIKQQMQENYRLRSELLKRTQEVEKYKSDDPVSRRTHSDISLDQGVDGHTINQSTTAIGNQEARVRNVGESSVPGEPGNLVQQHELMSNGEDPVVKLHAENGLVNGALKGVGNAGFSRVSSPSMLPFSPTSNPMEGQYYSQILSGHPLVPVAEENNHNSLWKQDLALKVREHEEEIMLLRKHLAEYSVKEAQIRNEKVVLEKRIAYMRMAFDQQQQDLVDAASKALSYRQDIIEENIRLTYALQEAQQERSTFVSSLLPLLAEYSLQPPVPDAHSIVTNLKVLFKHLQEKLIIIESKWKDSQYQLMPWNSDLNRPNFAPQSPSSVGAALTTSNKNGLELVPQPTFSQPISATPVSSSDARWDLLGHQNYHDDLGRHTPPVSRNSAPNDIPPAQLAVSQGDLHRTRYSEETTSKQVTFSDLVSSSEMDDTDAEAHHSEREPSANWGSGNSTYAPTHEDPSGYSPYLPPVLEEPSSSLSEAADDDPLPAIDALQISGEAFPGQELQACGFSINGTTNCNFEWVRHMEDGSFSYIEGAKQPNYLVTADDVETYLAIEVQPLDDRKRKGELVKVFANDHRKITCDAEMHSHIEKTLHTGHAFYKVLFSTGYLDIWEPATLVIKKEGYSIKSSGTTGVIFTEKFSQSTRVTIPYGDPNEFLITGSGGAEHLLRTDNSSDIGFARDTIVLTMRYFILRAGARRKTKKRGLFF